MITIETKNDREAFNEIIENNFKPTVSKSAYMVASEVVFQLISLWMLATLAISVWRFCTGC
jgi:hypothetical protein